MMDGSLVRAHQHAAGARGGQEHQALGRSRGGFSLKIHAKVNKWGLPLKFILTGGQENEIKHAKSLLNKEGCEYLLADHAYDSYAFREELKIQGIQAVIRPIKRRYQKQYAEYDKNIYKERNYIE